MTDEPANVAAKRDRLPPSLQLTWADLDNAALLLVVPQDGHGSIWVQDGIADQELAMWLRTVADYIGDRDATNPG